MSRAGSVMLVAIIAGCSGSGEQPKPEPVPATPSTADAGADAVPMSPVADGGAQVRPAQTRPGRPIEIILRSSPPGAQVSVDGSLLGPTPQLWVGETGAEHEFTFTAPDYAMARYRFRPITTGILHARLEPVAEEIDAGVSAPPEVVPPGPVVPAVPSVVDAPPAPLAPPLDAFTPDATAPGLGPPF